MSTASTGRFLAPTMRAARHVRRLGLAIAALALGGAAGAVDTTRLRIVGGLAGVNQYTRHEAPFWTIHLARASGGRLQAEIVPADRAGIRAQEMLPLIQRGVVPFGTVLMAPAATRDPEVGAADLAGLNPDMPTLKRHVAAYRPALEALLREKFGIELLAIYTYPAQVIFCRQAFGGLSDLRGRRVRTSSPTQSDWVAAIGASPVSIGFAETVPAMRHGNLDCAITGTMSGFTIGLNDLTTHIHPMAVTWGLSFFAAHGATWRTLDPGLRSLLRSELRTLEAAIWDEAERETDQGIACNLGKLACIPGRTGRMTLVPASTADAQRSQEVFESAVLAEWVRRCGASCVSLWNRSLGPSVGIEARTR